MANLNLSQFTEKTFVADADWTFVWDTAGLISKKVSRNNWLNSGELTTSAPVTISQTWNAGAVAFTALKVNAVSTASASGSLLLDLQVGAVSQLNVTKAGVLFLTSSTASGGIDFNGYGFMSAFNWQMRNTNGYIGLGATATEADTRLYRDTANTLALRNGINPQTFNVYGTYTSITDYRRLSISVDNTTGNATILVNKGSATTGVAGELSITSPSALNLKGNVYFSNAAGTLSWRIDSNFFPQANNSFDFGSASLRIKSGYFGTSVVNAGYAEHAEMTAPAAPAANSVRIYAEDNGSGKTRLMALFATGVAQQIAIEP